MAIYRAPGVYVEEVSSGARPITAVEMATVAILGVAPDPATHVGEPHFVSSHGEFVERYRSSARAPNTLATAVAGFFANGGSRCYVLNLGKGAETVTPDALAKLDKIEGIDLLVAPGFVDDATYKTLVTHCEDRGDRMAILDLPDDFDIDKQPRRPRASEQGLAAVYTPWIETRDVVTGDRATHPPSAYIAGLYALTDARRGVHKAPANLGVRGATGLSQRITSADQDRLNQIGVNCIRQFPDGIRVWGARTVATSDSEWRYVPVRRFAMMVSQSVTQGTRWVVFEPNDATLWKSVRRDVGAFLADLWRAGALAGETPEQAFFVRCDETTMSQADVDTGRVIVEIGFAPVRPAEFIILRISQKAGGAE